MQQDRDSRPQDNGTGLRITVGVREANSLDVRPSAPPPPAPGSVVLYLMNYTALNQHHNPSRPLSQKVFKEMEGQEEERL